MIQQPSGEDNGGGRLGLFRLPVAECGIRNHGWGPGDADAMIVVKFDIGVALPLLNSAHQIDIHKKRTAF
jgi:hypothetical protein